MTSTRRSRALLAASVVLVTLLYSIDSTIVNVALPHMQGSLQATQDQAAWIATAYIVVSAIVTPLMGWFGSRYGLRTVMLVSIIGFTICSMLCGAATSLTEIVLFRAMQGAFGSALIPLSQVTILEEFPAASFKRVMAAWATASMIGPVIGPTLGGYLTENLSWRWAFYINLPIGVLAWLGITASMPRRQAKTHRPFDVTGFIFLSFAVGLLQLMLDRGQTLDWFDSPEIVAELFFSAICFYVYIGHALTHRHPFVDPHLFRDRNYTMCLLIQAAIGATSMSPSVLLPTFLQQLQGYSPAQTGWIMGSRGAAGILAMAVVNRLPARLDPRISMMGGMLLGSVTLWSMGSFSIDTPASYFVTTGLLLGVSMPFTFIPTQLLAFSTLPKTSRTEAGVVLRLGIGLGGAIGISAVVAELARSAQINHSYLTEFFTPYSVDRWQAIGGNAAANTATGSLIGEISRQALSIAYANDFHLLAIMSLICVPLICMIRPIVDAERPAVPVESV